MVVVGLGCLVGVVVGAERLDPARVILVSWRFAVFAECEGVVHQMFVPQLFTFTVPPYCLDVLILLVLNPESKVSVIFKTRMVFVCIYELHHDGEVFEHFVVILWVEV